MLLSTAYFPPISYFALLAKDFTLSPDRVFPSQVELEACENFCKQSYRNRCDILSSQGKVMLQVPVVHAADMQIRSVRVDYSTPWVLKTQRAIDAAYHSSAFFDYYRDEVYELLDAKPERLFDLNLSLIQYFLRRIGIACEISLTQEFIRPGMIKDDYRETIHPKRPNEILSELGLEKPYYQVFSQRYGFVSDLSIMDLLFNEGPAAISCLK